MIFVEVLDRRGDVISRTPIERLPLTIGRAYTNDVILDDVHISPEHARIEAIEGGSPVVVDLDSKNGLFLAGRRARVASIELDGEKRIRLGRTILRIRDGALPVSPTRPLMRLPVAVEWALNRWSAALALLVAVWVATMARDHRHVWAKFEWLDLVQEPLALVAVMAMWASAWALVTRLLIHRPSFVAHWAITALAVLASYAMDEAFFYARFLLAAIEPLQLAALAYTGTLVTLSLFAHLSVTRVATVSSRAGVALLLGLGVFGVQLLDHVGSDEQWVSTLPYWSRLKDVDPGLLPVRTVHAFFSEVREIGPELDALAEED